MTKSALSPNGAETPAEGSSARTTTAYRRESGSPCTPSPTLEAMPTTIGDKHPCHHHRGGVRSRPYVRAGRQDRTQTLVRPVVDAARLVRRSSLRALARIGRLAHPQRAVCERVSVHALHLDERWRPCVAVVHRTTEGAALPGVQGLVTRRGQLARMAEHVPGLRSEVAA